MVEAGLLTRAGGALLAAFALTGAGCSGNLPAPRLGDGEHTGEDPQIVVSMPPPGNVEIVPPRPRGLKNAIWVDGEWQWTGRRWAWLEHGWQEAPPKQLYDPPTTKRLPDGRLVHFAGKWKPEPTK